MILKNIWIWIVSHRLTTTTHTTVAGWTRKHRTTTPDSITQNEADGCLGPEPNGETPKPPSRDFTTECVEATHHKKRQKNHHTQVLDSSSTEPAKPNPPNQPNATRFGRY